MTVWFERMVTEKVKNLPSVLKHNSRREAPPAVKRKMLQNRGDKRYSSLSSREHVSASLNVFERGDVEDMDIVLSSMTQPWTKLGTRKAGIIPYFANRWMYLLVKELVSILSEDISLVGGINAFLVNANMIDSMTSLSATVLDSISKKRG